MKLLEILRPGPLTTVQDLGRVGFARYGVPPAGAMDAWALQVGNILVGNPRPAAALEMTMRGVKIRFLAKTVIAITGGQGVSTINGKQIEYWKSIFIEPGDILDIGSIREGCRAYLALAGGIMVPQVLGSRSTYIPAALGGLAGRALGEGDILEGCPLEERRYSPRALSWRYIPDYTGECTLRVITGIDAEMFAPDVIQAFYTSVFTVSGECNRMGCRLQEPLPLAGHFAPSGVSGFSGFQGNKVSDAVVRGAIQVPPNGQPIILGAEQTVGGYPVIAVVAGVDYPLAAQLSIGQKVRFEEISLAQAENLRIEMEKFLRIIENA